MVGEFPIKYLAIPLQYGSLRREDLQRLVDNLLKRLAGWRGKLLCSAANRELVQSCLASIPVYLLSFFKFPKWAIDLINSQLANCLWNDLEGNHKIHLANWPLVCIKRDLVVWGFPTYRILTSV